MDYHRSLVDSSKFILLNKFACINMVFFIIIIIIIIAWTKTYPVEK